MDDRIVTAEQKNRQMAREAKYCLSALAAIIIFWVIAGFGVDALGLTVGRMPLWVITGCGGTWIFASVLTAWLTKRVFRDFSLEDESL